MNPWRAEATIRTPHRLDTATATAVAEVVCDHPEAIVRHGPAGVWVRMIVDAPDPHAAYAAALRRLASNVLPHAPAAMLVDLRITAPPDHHDIHDLPRSA